MYRLNQHETPLFSALMEYVNNKTIPFHVPGHKKGVGAEESFKEFIGENAFKIDVTVFKMVDSLHHPTGPIKKAQELAADAYGADASFFSIHGTSGAIQAMILSVVGDGDKILIPRNVHKSVTSGIILSGATPIFMTPELDRRLGIAQGVTPEVVEKALNEHPEAKAVLIINPTYYGVSTDIKRICDIVHNHGIPLIVDEAHGPHLGFNNKLPMSAIEAGADICAQSTHKIIGALTQGSLLHVKSKYINPKRVQQVLNLLHTTSPSYILMASLDCARKQIALQGKDLMDKTIELCNYARNEINKIEGLYCFGEEILGEPGVYALDPTKLTINCRELGITGYELERYLATEHHIQVEMSDLYNVLAVGSFGDTKESIDSLISALKEISMAHIELDNKKPDFLDIPEIPEMKVNPRVAFNAEKKSLLIGEAIGEISGEFLMAYPPGIPVLCPGEIITPEIVHYIKDLKRAGLYVQGTQDPKVEHINVLTE
ncbi:MAG: aminotransferase class I/II-fold pyridoxal phosphate-dependent enzyme [Clostridiaceae bacterium]